MASQGFPASLSPSPSPSHSSLSGSSQKRKRSAPEGGTAGEFMASSTRTANSNLLNGDANAQQQHPFIMPLSSLDSQHALPENPGSSLEDEDESENGGKNGPSYGRFEGANGRGDGDEEEDDDDEGEANDEEGEQDDGKTLTKPFTCLRYQRTCIGHCCEPICDCRFCCDVPFQFREL
jgi:hypothetical protein